MKFILQTLRYTRTKKKEQEEIAPFAENLQKDKGKAPQQSPEEKKPSGKSEESNQSPIIVSLKPSKLLIIITEAKRTKQKSWGKFVVFFMSIMQNMDSDSKSEDDTPSSQVDTQQI